MSIEGDGTKVMQYHRYYTSAYILRSQYFQPIPTIPNVQHAVQRRTPMHQYDQRGNNITQIFDCQAQLHMEQADYDINKLGLSSDQLKIATLTSGQLAYALDIHTLRICRCFCRHVCRKYLKALDSSRMV